MRILLVDDDPIILDLLSMSFAEQGFTDVTLAASAREALDAVNAQDPPFDCFLLDIFMEGINGIELCSMLRRRQEYKAAPIIMITSAQELVYMDRAFKAGATDFLRKPLDAIELTARIGTAMLLVEAARRERENRRALGALISHASDWSLIDASNRICFPDAKGMLDYFELENSLMRLAEGNYQVTLCRLELTSLLGSKTGKQSTDAIRVIHDVSLALGAMKFKKPVLYSYIGAGRFICCAIGRMMWKKVPLDQHIKGVVHCALHEVDRGAPDTVEFSTKSLHEERIISKSALLNLIRREYKLATTRMIDTLPKVCTLEDNIFTTVSGIKGR